MSSARTTSAASQLREQNDEALWPFIDAPDELTRAQELRNLLESRARPAIASAIRRVRQLEPSLCLENAEEMIAAILERLSRRARAAALYEEHAIRALEPCVAALTREALEDFRRRRYPQRHRLRRNLRYIMTRQPEFALWEDDSGPVAGLFEWTGQPPHSSALPFATSSATPAMRDRDRPVQSLRAVLTSIDHPLPFDLLIDVMANLWDIRDGEEDGDILAAERGHPHDGRHDREYIEALWLAIRHLPDQQRRALLLNLRDPHGLNAVTLFLLLNVADASEIAASLGLTMEAFTELWEMLPLDDVAVAERMDVTRARVMELRKAARLGLAERMGKWR